MATEVISAWDVYWVLQLDRIVVALFWMPIAAVVVTLFGACVSEGESVWDSSKKRARGYVKYMCAAIIASWLICLFLPSSKTAAAMVVLPAIANNETIQREAGDLYGLAKQALRDAVGGDEKQEPQK